MGIPWESHGNPNDVPGESHGNPKGREGNRTEPNRREPNRTEPNRTEETSFSAAAEKEAATAAASEMRFLQGALGKGVVLLTDQQIEDLLDRMGLDAFDQYVDKLATFITRKQAKVKNHYATILQWWQEDREVK